MNIKLCWFDPQSKTYLPVSDSKKVEQLASLYAKLSEKERRELISCLEERFSLATLGRYKHTIYLKPQKGSKNT